MNTIISFVVTGAFIALFIAVAIYLMSLWMKFLTKVQTKNIQRRIASGKINDTKLTKLYIRLKKSKDNTFMAIFFSGIYYKPYLKMQNIIYELYKEEMIKRNLPL